MELINMLSVIVAIANNNVIGKDNNLIWHLPNDLERFKKITTGKTIIMGRKTFESLPCILPNRHHIVLTRDASYEISDKRVTVIHNINELTTYIDDDMEHFIIGGGEVYSLLLPYAKKLYITKIEADFEGDTYFPYYDLGQWILTDESCNLTDASINLTYKYLIFNRK